MHRAFTISPVFSFDMNIRYIYIRGSLTSQSLRLHLTCPRISSITLRSSGFSRQGTYVFLLILLRKSVIKAIFIDWFKILTWLKFDSEPPELFFGVFFLIFFRGAFGVPFDLGFTPGLPSFGGDLLAASVFSIFFNRHHFFFHISFVPPSFGSGFDDAGFVAFTGLLRSLPYNIHLFPVCLFHEVQFGIEYLLF